MLYIPHAFSTLHLHLQEDIKICISVVVGKGQGNTRWCLRGLSEGNKRYDREPTKCVLQIEQLGNGTKGPARYGWSSRKWVLQEKSQEVGGAKCKTPHETLTVKGGGLSLTLKHWALTEFFSQRVIGAFAVKSLSQGLTLSLHSIRTEHRFCDSLC